jgi:hypothetical protein
MDQIRAGDLIALSAIIIGFGATIIAFASSARSQWKKKQNGSGSRGPIG